MAFTLLMVPMTLFVVFSKSEIATHRWLQADHDLHVEVLDHLRGGRFAGSADGQALAALAAQARVEAGDVHAYMVLIVELVLRAEEIMLARQDGRPPPDGADIAGMFVRMDALAAAIGESLVLAAQRHAGVSRNDMWELGRLRVRAMRPAKAAR
jgi:hypothetical protein